MDYSREIFAPLFRDLLHLEVTLLSHPFTDRTSAPDPENQCLDIMKCYTAVLQEANPQPIESADIIGAAFEARESPSASHASGSEQPVNSFAEIASYAEETLSEIKNQQETHEAGTQAVETAGGAAAEAGQAEAGRRDQINKLTRQEQKVLTVRSNALHIEQLLGEMREQPAESGKDGSLPAHEAVGSSKNAGQTGSINWTPEGVMQIRKYWEVRPDDGVLMRTVIGMDGDVVAHINPAIVGEDFRNLHRLHEQSVETSVRFWKELAGILSDFVTNVIKALTTS